MAKVIALLGFGIALVLSAIGLSSVTREVPFELDAAEISHAEGYAYRAHEASTRLALAAGQRS